MIFKQIVMALERIEHRQRHMLDRLKELESAAAEQKRGPRKAEWLECGIDNILGFEVKQKKRGE